MTATDIERLDDNIKQNREFIKRGTALERLYANKDFKEVVINGYFKEEAIRLVHLKSDPSMQSASSQESIIKQIDAIGALSDYFRTVKHQSTTAVHAIAADEETREELLAQELEA